MLFKSKRVMEPESMETMAEVYAYDRLALRYLAVLHNGFVETVINSSPETGRFLDVGSGTGRISIGLAKIAKNAIVEGVELSENMLRVARDNAVREGVSDMVKFSIGDAKELPFEDDSFDCVFCHQLLHHIPDPITVVREIDRVTKSDGAILIRDLIRQSDLIVPFHVHIFGLPYNRLMKNEYRNSIKAALSEDEWLQLSREAGIEESRVTKQFVTHQGIERSAKNRRNVYFEVPTPLILRPFKNMYVGKPSPI